MLDAGCWMLDARKETLASGIYSLQEKKCAPKPRRGDKIIAQGKRDSAPPWVGCRKYV